MMQATLKKKLMKEGLLDEKGKPNDKTPSDWHTRYKEFTHHGETAPNGQSSTSTPKVQEVEKDEPEQQEESEDKPKQKKKKKKSKEREDD
jgi:H/ACA ribonucleoprotein complex subunit 4